ncbi:Rho GTPase-activating protein 21-A [Taenia solium]|eukprot:TsM_000333700 transcript=TsM_000333700 gene=TsM_000333700
MLQTHNIAMHIADAQSSRSPPSLCEGSWSHPLSNCELIWSDVAAMDLRSIANCGLLQSGQLHPICCTFRVHNEEVSDPDYTCRMYFLQQDQRLEAVITDLKGLSESPDTRSDLMCCFPHLRTQSESPSSQKTAADTNRTGLSSLLNSGQNNRGGNLGVAGPPGGFPLMVAAETLAASFGVHMNRSQTGSLDTASRISMKKPSSGASKSGASYTSLQSPPHDSSSPTPDVGSSHHKSSLLRSTFARMRQVAMGGAQMNSSTTAPSATTTVATSSSSFLTGTSTAAVTSSTSTTPRSAFHQRLTHFSQTFAHDKSSPRRRKLNQASNELAVTMPMQLAVVDAAMVAASGGTSTCVEATRAGVEGGVRVSDADHEDYDHTATMQQSHVPVERSTGKGLEPASTTRSISVTTAVMNTSHSQRELNAQTARRLLRRPTDPNMSIDSEPGDLQEAVLLDPPILHPERSLVGSLPLHQCARSTFSAFVPFVVELCVTLVEKFGLNCVGIYRVSGNKLAHDFMAAELCKQLGEIDATNEKWNDIHALACVLKTLLRNLPDSLIPKVMYPEFLAASRVESWERRLLSVQRLLSIMECYPKHPEYRVHRATLRYLATHLARVASRQAVNRMTAYNLALVFAPNLIQSNEDSPELFIADSKFKIWLLETIIKYHKWVFSPDLGLESGCFVPEDSDKVLLTDEALAEAMAASSSGTSQDLEFANQPGRSEGDVRPVLQEMLHAAALLPPPPSTSDLEVAEEPGPSLDKPTDVATVVEQALESSAVELQEIQQQQQQQQQLQQHHQRQRNRPVSQPGGENRSHNQERITTLLWPSHIFNLLCECRKKNWQKHDGELCTPGGMPHPRRLQTGQSKSECSSIGAPARRRAYRLNHRRRILESTLLIIPEDHCDVGREDSSSARMQHSLLAQSPTTAPPSPRISSFNQSQNPSTNTTNKSASSSRWRPFHRQRRHSGGEAPHSKSTMEMAVVEAGEEIYSISHLVAFRRTKSCRRRGDRCAEAGEALSETLELTTRESEEQSQQMQKHSTPPSSSSETPFPVRHHSLRKWWFR